MGPYKPLRTWVEFPIPYYMEMSWELIDPIAHVNHSLQPSNHPNHGGSSQVSQVVRITPIYKP